MNLAARATGCIDFLENYLQNLETNAWKKTQARIATPFSWALQLHPSSQLHQGPPLIQATSLTFPLQQSTVQTFQLTADHDLQGNAWIKIRNFSFSNHLLFWCLESSKLQYQQVLWFCNQDRAVECMTWSWKKGGKIRLPQKQTEKIK